MASGEKAFKKGDEYKIQQTVEKQMEGKQNDKKNTVKETPRRQFSNRIDDDTMLTQDQICDMLTTFDPAEQLTIDSIVSVVGFRRQGKTKIVEYMIHNYMKKNKVDAVILFSKSGAGFKNICSSYRFKNIKVLDDVINLQLKVNKHNAKCSPADRVASRVICVVDDFIDKARMTDVKKSNTIVALSSKGRHLSQKLTINGKEVVNGVMLVMISQSFTAIPKIVRQNTDWTLCSALANRLERKKLVESYFTLFSGRFGLREAYKVYDCATNTAPYQFAVIHGTCSNKFDYSDYIFTYKAEAADIPFYRWCGDDDDWQNNEPEIFFWA